MRLAQRTTFVSIAFAVAAIAAPAASAQFDLAPAGAQSGRAESQTTSTTPTVRANPDQQVMPASQVGPPTLQSATASQLPEVHRQQAAASHALAYKPTQSKPYSSAGLNGYVSSPTNGGPAVVHITTHNNPFDWGDAAIGAAGGIVISLLIVGGAVVVTQRRQPKASRAKALA
jgi:hypothetical protein